MPAAENEKTGTVHKVDVGTAAPFPRPDQVRAEVRPLCGAPPFWTDQTGLDFLGAERMCLRCLNSVRSVR